MILEGAFSHLIIIFVVYAISVDVHRRCRPEVSALVLPLPPHASPSVCERRSRPSPAAITRTSARRAVACARLCLCGTPPGHQIVVDLLIVSRFDVQWASKSVSLIHGFSHSTNHTASPAAMLQAIQSSLRPAAKNPLIQCITK